MSARNDSPVIEGNGTLVLLLHAYTKNALSLSSLKQAVKKQWPHALIYSPDLPLELSSTADPNQIAADVLLSLENEINNAGHPITNIVFVGHSFGALLARKIYVVACGETAEAPFESPFHARGEHLSDGRLASRPWATNVSRLILMPGMNRGWRINHHLHLFRAAGWLLGIALGNAMRAVTGRTFTICSIRQGAEFITQLRIQWIRMRRNSVISQTPTGNATTIQLLGSRDDIVGPDDNIDLVSGGEFIYLDVPYSGHADVVNFDDPQYGAGRKNVFIDALTDPIPQLKQSSILPADDPFASPNPLVTRVAFVIHGIRDKGYWTQKIARHIKQRNKNSPNIWATETSTYGYFPMLPFLFPWYRRQKVEWLMDQYTQALARYPNATFCYVGHSNGTYMLAKALELYPCCFFENVVFAGSVVHRNYNWDRYLNSSPPRVKAVLNFVATRDWVVACFPKFFQFMGFQDLGSAGHDGFTLSPQSNAHQVTYIPGGHSAAIEEPLWECIASFIDKGTVALGQNNKLSRSRVILLVLIGLFPPIVWAMIALIAWGGWMLLACIITALVPQSIEAQTTGFALATYLLFLWLLLTRI